jgi:hypothetical protein
MKSKWRLVLMTAPIGVALALFQNCGQSTRQVRILNEAFAPGGLVTEKSLDVLTFGTNRAHVDLSESLSPSSEVTLEMTNYSESEPSEISVTNKSGNLLVFPLSLEGMCPSADAFDETAERELTPITPGAGYLIRDMALRKFAYLRLIGFTGEVAKNGSNLNLIQMSFIVVSPKPGVDFDRFLHDLCGEPSLALGPSLQ